LPYRQREKITNGKIHAGKGIKSSQYDFPCRINNSPKGIFFASMIISKETWDKNTRRYFSFV
jgi:hypothetical protein